MYCISKKNFIFVESKAIKLRLKNLIKWQQNLDKLKK
jgi:hypothetical protein